MESVAASLLPLATSVCSSATWVLRPSTTGWSAIGAILHPDASVSAAAGISAAISTIPAGAAFAVWASAANDAVHASARHGKSFAMKQQELLHSRLAARLCYYSR